MATRGLADRSRVIAGDYRAFAEAGAHGRTLYLGNPPYVRHHQIGPEWKRWLTDTARKQGIRASQLAGLHVHFFLATAEHARAGDRGAFITSAEWLDVNYGALLRELCCSASAVSRSMSSRPRHSLSRTLRRPERSPAFRSPPGPRGAVTGANRFWIVDLDSAEQQLPARVLFRTVTRARELFAAGQSLASSVELKAVVDLPSDLGEFDSDERKAIESFLSTAKHIGVHEGYVARHRRAWWSVGLREPAPILSTYMARRVPAIVRNLAGARHINIAHGIYPREAFGERAIERIAEGLRACIHLGAGRTYSGGLTKFEPREMERLLVPDVTQPAA